MIDFWAVFLGVSFAEIARMLFERYLKSSVVRRLDEIEKKYSELKDALEPSQKRTRNQENQQHEASTKHQPTVQSPNQAPPPYQH